MSQIQLHKTFDENKVPNGYNCITWNGPDQGMIVTKYTIQEAQDKWGSLLDPGNLGTSNSPDRITMNFNDETGDMTSIQAEVTSMSQDKFEIAAPLNQADLTDVQLSQVSVARLDVETKTGATISGDSIELGGGGIKLPPIK